MKTIIIINHIYLVRTCKMYVHCKFNLHLPFLATGSDAVCDNPESLYMYKGRRNADYRRQGDDVPICDTYAIGQFQINSQVLFSTMDLVAISNYEHI